MNIRSTDMIILMFLACIEVMMVVSFANWKMVVSSVGRDTISLWKPSKIGLQYISGYYEE
jgi:hypothetical protein